MFLFITVKHCHRFSNVKDMYYLTVSGWSRPVLCPESDTRVSAIWARTGRFQEGCPSLSIQVVAGLRACGCRTEGPISQHLFCSSLSTCRLDSADPPWRVALFISSCGLSPAHTSCLCPLCCCLTSSLQLEDVLCFYGLM